MTRSCPLTEVMSAPLSSRTLAASLVSNARDRARSKVVDDSSCKHPRSPIEKPRSEPDCNTHRRSPVFHHVVAVGPAGRRVVVVAVVVRTVGVVADRQSVVRGCGVRALSVSGRFDISSQERREEKKRIEKKRTE